jgi:hypothetical protein
MQYPSLFVQVRHDKDYIWLELTYEDTQKVLEYQIVKVQN